MFDSTAVQTAETAALAVTAHHAALVQHEVELLQLAAHWADLHAEPPRERGRGARRLVLGGGPGTPEVDEFAAAELGLLQDTTTGSARRQMSDALDLRHRLPLLWSMVCAGGFRVWKARNVAAATHHLSLAAARQIDAALAPHIATLPWSRVETMLEGQIIAADPDAAQRRQELADAERFVRVGRKNEHGLRILIARANSGDVIYFMAMLNRIAEILQLEGDLETVEVRRSRAFGILAQPARALELLCRHRQDDNTDVASDSPNTDLPEDSGAPGESGAPDQRDVRLDVPESLARVAAKKLLPPATLHLHLSAEAVQQGQGVARVEQVGPVVLAKLRDLLAGCSVTVKPIVDPADGTGPVDAYEVPRRMRDHLVLRNPYEVFPFGQRESRPLDLDHTLAYRPPERGGGPGQTRPGNLGPLSRFNHRVKTHGGWRVRQPSEGLLVWRSPLGYISVVTNRGTIVLGRDAFATATWESAAFAERSRYVAAS